jgi:hypothetical protein
MKLCCVRYIVDEVGRSMPILVIKEWSLIQGGVTRKQARAFLPGIYGRVAGSVA